MHCLHSAVERRPSQRKNLKKENGKETEKRKGKRMKKEKTAPNAARPNGQPDRPNIFRPIQSCLRTRGIHGKTGSIGQQGGKRRAFKNLTLLITIKESDM